MKFFYRLSLASMATLAIAAPTRKVSEGATNPKLYLAGDSTMALGGNGAGTQGWGVYLPYSLSNIQTLNYAKAGRSARSYTVEGRFTTLIDAVVPGDYVIIEFGHNDGGSLSPTDNLRTDCFGSGSETCTTAAGLVVQTYVTYLTNAASALVAKGAKVIIASPTPDNPCENDPACGYTPNRFTAYAKKVVENVGAGATFVDHGAYVAQRYKALGKSVVDNFYPNDHTHTSPEGANDVAGMFVKGLLCVGGDLAAFVKNGTTSVAGSCI